MRRGDEAHVDFHLFVAAHRLHALFLQRAKQLRLQRQRQVADLVEEQRALMRLLEQALRVVLGARERAAHVTEQLALEQALGNRRDVDGNEAPLASRAATVEGARTSSLPVPLSPKMSTLARPGAMRATTLNTSSICGERPAIESRRSSLGGAISSVSVAAARRFSIARWSSAPNESSVGGLAR